MMLKESWQWQINAHDEIKLYQKLETTHCAVHFPFIA